ncbi:protein WHAT'S THIS FACTOR 1 homolog, chloroplastic [Silene latifolia]|uniref:protein WHAT'S THIS FACTOR 1 homolog, chloroplastic n=1 Tax=Silene latifolia TaxID=37657 RepID=UPI003D780B4B
MSLRLITKQNPRKYIPQFTRQMTSSRRVGDRSKKKRVHHLEIVTEKWKIFSKIHFLMEVIQSQPESVIPISNLDHYRRQINLPKPYKMSDFLKKSPEIFDFYKDCKGVLWVGMTQKAEELLDEEEKVIGLYSDQAAEYVTRCLMMSINKRLRIDKIAHFRRDFGLPLDFRKDWVHNFPSLFRVAKCREGDDEIEYLELVEWKKEWAVTELEKRIGSLCGEAVGGEEPGMLSLAFPMKFPPMFKDVYKFSGKLEQFQRREYLSPYADARGLMAGSVEFDKRAVAIMHELLSFTLEKRLVTDHLTHFRREMVMPQKLMRLLLKHFGIFYVSERGKRFHVFLNEAYEGSELIEKSPLVLWREKVHSLIGYRGKRKAATFEELSDVEDKNMWNSESEDEGSQMDLEKENTISVLDDDLLADDDEMDIDEVSRAYKDG